MTNFKGFLGPGFTSKGSRIASWGPSVVFGLGLFSVYIYIFPYLGFLKHANEMPRLFLTEALARSWDYHVDEGISHYRYRKAMDLSRSLCLGRRITAVARRALGAQSDRIRNLEWFCRERRYSNKAPGQSMLAVPFLKTANLLARRKGRRATLAERLWWVRLGTSVLPTLILLLLMAYALKSLVPESHPRLAVVVAYGLGSLAMPYALQFMSHQLSAMLLFLAFVLLWTESPGPVRLAGAGLAAGAAVLSDYQAAFAAAAVAGYGLYRCGLKPKILWAAAGGALPAALLLHYHKACFGWPLWTGYEFLLDLSDQALHREGVLGMTAPKAEAFWGSFFSARDGLFFLSPWLLLAIPGFALLLGNRAGTGPDGPSAGGRLRSREWVWKAVGLVLAVCAAVAALLSNGLKSGPWAVPAASALRYAGWAAAAWALSGVVLVLFRGELKADASSAHRVGGMELGFQTLLIVFAVAGLTLASIARDRTWTVLVWAALPAFVHCTDRFKPVSLRGWRWWSGVALGLHSVTYLIFGPLFTASGFAERITGWCLAGLWGFAGAGGGLQDRPETARFRPEGLLCLSVAGFYVWFISSLTFWHGGWQVGPRYLAVMLPFWVLPAAAAFRYCWHRGWAWTVPAGLTLVGMTVYVLSSATFPHFPKSFTNPLFDLVGYLMARGYVARNAGETFFGLRSMSSLLPYLGAAGLFGLYVAFGRDAFGRFRKETGKRLVAGVLALCLAAWILGAMSRVPKTDFQKCCGWITRFWDAELHQRKHPPRRPSRQYR